MSLSQLLENWTLIDLIAVIIAITIISVTLLATLSTFLFLGKQKRSEAETIGKQIAANSKSIPLVTILKPIKGFYDDLPKNLASFLNLEDVAYEVIIGIAEGDDAAIPIVQQFLQEHPEAPMKLVLTNTQSNSNLKVINLLNLEPLIKGEIILISDDNTRANPGCLKPLVAAFEDAKVGWACAPFFIRQPKTLGTRLRSIFIGSQLTKIMCSIYYFTGVTPTMGKWMAIRKQALEEMGGFATLTNFLGEDGVLEIFLTPLGWKGSFIPTAIDVYNKLGHNLFVGQD
jgi:ceramide glucosyltransferase